ncbi:oxidoreductase [Sphaerisporangium flaviroseum]|uniref:Oxidoreductase n=1 Tax=Sphaerisporangium flaviroseum TaxID=509199 RepID=A0ABP7JCG6_9ACTN
MSNVAVLGGRLELEGLSEAERRVWEAFPAGREVSFMTGRAQDDLPMNGGGWGSDRTVRASVIAAMLLGDEAPVAHRIPALRISGVRVTGRLELAYSTVRHSARLSYCHFDEEPSLYWARCTQLNFRGSWMPGLSCSNAQIEGHLRLEECLMTGPLRLRGTHVVGGLMLTGAHLTGPRGVALYGERLHVGRDLSAGGGFTAAGEVRLLNATVEGTTYLDGARITCPKKAALVLDSMITEGGVYCRGARIVGQVSARHARFTGPVILSGSVLSNPGGRALRATRLTADGGMHLDYGFTAEGAVRLTRSRIGRQLSFNKAKLIHPDGEALQAEDLTVDGTLTCNGLSSRGTLYMPHAHITGSAGFVGAVLSTPGGVALQANGMTVDGSLTCTDGFRTEGETDLTDARIGKGLDMSGAHLGNPDGVALDAAGVTVGGGMLCHRGFTAEGETVLVGARIGRHLRFSEARLSAPGGNALRAPQMEAREVILQPRATIEGIVDLRHARIGVIRDDPETWPVIRQDGLSYEALDPDLPANRRLRWLAADPDGYLPQPYEQLAGTYRRLGNETDARTVLLAKHRKRRTTLPLYARSWGLLQDWTVGYGYRPARAGFWLLTLLVAGAAVFTVNGPPPVEAGKGPAFNAVMYALDLLLPLIDFGQEKAFQPSGGGQWVAYGLIVTGWVLATTIAAGITRALSRQ